MFLCATVKKGLRKQRSKNNNEIATKIVGSWNEPYEFDDLAFKNAVYGIIKIKVKEVQKE